MYHLRMEMAGIAKIMIIITDANLQVYIPFEFFLFYFDLLIYIP